MVDQGETNEFDEIPELVKQQAADLVRSEVFDILHLEAVQRGDVPQPPHTLYDQLTGRIAKLFFHIGLGSFVGTLAVFACVAAIRKLTTVL
jgi:hypothetical protein